MFTKYENKASGQFHREIINDYERAQRQIFDSLIEGVRMERQNGRTPHVKVTFAKAVGLYFVSIWSKQMAEQKVQLRRREYEVFKNLLQDNHIEIEA